MTKQDLFNWLDEYFTKRQEVSIAEAARIKGVCRNTLKKRIKEGKIEQLPNGKISRAKLLT